MKQASVCIEHGAVSLDGGIIREDGLISLGFWKSDIIFPVVTSEIHINTLPEITQVGMQIAEAMSELRVTLCKIRKITRACEEDKRQFFGKTKDFISNGHTAEAFMKNHCPKVEFCPDNYVYPTISS
ncbi:hypothetical protein ACJRO7_032220 [Eucalyptus globulus]|uniref:Uncharacterized protein n=1 Tax=Eucalyptus globulus TaxID=34317 RepID=A0ABD3JH72_EUCGL